jgi:hypothetical protein
VRVLHILLCGAVSLGAGGCGSDIAPFVGSWIYESGQATASCAFVGQIGTLSLVGSAIVLTQDSNGTLSETTGSGCQLKFKVTGQTASLVSPVSCALSLPLVDGGVQRQPISYQSQSFTIDSTGKTLVEAGSLSLSISVAPPLSVSCTLATSGTLSKL